MPESISTSLAQLNLSTQRQKQAISEGIARHQTQIEIYRQKIRNYDSRIAEIRRNLWTNWPKDKDRKDYEAECRKDTLRLEQERDEIKKKILTEEKLIRDRKREEEKINRILERANAAIEKANK